MKIAGRKNDGAWFRTNKLIKSLTNSEKELLGGMISEMTETGGWLEALQAFASAAGYTMGDPEYPSATNDIGINYSEGGIPRQAWFGRLSYDLYDRTGTSPNFVYTPRFQEQAHLFGKAIRKLMKEYTMSRRQAKDLPNIIPRSGGNPGGIADAAAGN